jgi:hypothetical protein
MSRKAVAAITLLFGIPAFALSHVIWPDPAGAPAPPPSMLPLLMVPSAFESLAFGAGIAFLVAGARHLVKIDQPRWLLWATYVSIGWSLVSWWPHVNLHRVSTSLASLVAIDWAFHVTLVLASSVVAFFVVRVLALAAGQAPAASATALVDVPEGAR